MRTAIVLVALVLGAGCPKSKAEDTTPSKPATPKEVVAAGRATIEQWRQAYEVRSIDALAKLYTHDLDTVVVQDGQTLIGWSSVEGMLKDRIARSKQIHVRLKDIQVTSLSAEAAFAVATMTRELSDGTTSVSENGALTLVLRHDADAWRIVAEHYSYKRN
jgi:ketosteroid isomerase-like protein